MANIYFPAASNLLQRTTSGSGYTEVVLGIVPNTIFFFDTASAMISMSSDVFNLTASQAATSSFVSSAWTRASMTAVSRSSNNSTDASESSLASVVLPGGTLGPNDWLRITTTWTYTNSVSTKRLFVDIGGVDFTEYSSTPSTVLAQLFTILGNTGTTGSQKGQSEFMSGVGTSGFDIVTSTLNTAQNQTIDFRCRWQVNISSSTEYIQLERYLIEVIRVN